MDGWITAGVLYNERELKDLEGEDHVVPGYSNWADLGMQQLEGTPWKPVSVVRYISSLSLP